jgi:hypothetical protein
VFAALVLCFFFFGLRWPVCEQIYELRACLSLPICGGGFDSGNNELFPWGNMRVFSTRRLARMFTVKPGRSRALFCAYSFGGAVAVALTRP